MSHPTHATASRPDPPPPGNTFGPAPLYEVLPDPPWKTGDPFAFGDDPADGSDDSGPVAPNQDGG